MIGPPDVHIKNAVLSFDINRILYIFANTDTFYRTTTTPLRFLVFIISIIFFILMILNKKKETNIPKFIMLVIPPAIYLFLATILITDNIYNYIAIFIILLSFYFSIFYSKNNLSLKEILVILSYLGIFFIAFYSSLLHITTTVSEIDNYVRFLLVIPVYLTLREIKFSLHDFFNVINITSILIGIFSIYCILVLGETRVKGFTSSAIIFGNISLLFSLFSFLTISYYINNNKNIFFPVIAFTFSFFAWGSTGTRGSIIFIIIFLILLTTKPFKETLKLPHNSIKLLLILIVSLIFMYSPILARYNAAYNSTYNYITEGSGYHWRHSDSIVPRINIWKGSIILIKKNTAKGVGLNNFNDFL
jgi:O-antigen ligase